MYKKKMKSGRKGKKHNKHTDKIVEMQSNFKDNKVDGAHNAVEDKEAMDERKSGISNSNHKR